MHWVLTTNEQTSFQVEKEQIWMHKLEMELPQVEMGIHHLKMHFQVVRYQMSHCYLCSESKTNMKKLYFEYFTAYYFPTLNKKGRHCTKYG